MFELVHLFLMLVFRSHYGNYRLYARFEVITAVAMKIHLPGCDAE
jgi:hypothetical protein